MFNLALLIINSTKLTISLEKLKLSPALLAFDMTNLFLIYKNFQECMSEAQATLIWAWIVAVFCIGGMIGGSCVGLIASGVGR
jgi:hypothetical protein